MKKIYITILSLILLAACDYNPVTKIPADKFAKAVNQYVNANFNTGIYLCAEYFLYPEKVEKTILYKLLGKVEFNKTCQKEMTYLTYYLHTNVKMKNIKANALLNSTAWKHYYTSKFAHPISRGDVNE